ncbi:MAG: SAM-dependent methyltransferase [Chloroflexi bacterium]|nr:MAG: SAM-dependent methyltransferase [Chloroflexota bacterium]
MTKTSSFGTSKREGHDSSSFYGRNLYSAFFKEPASAKELVVRPPELDGWVDQIYQQSATAMANIPDNGVALAFTSPPYNVGKEYDGDMGFEEYLDLIRAVGQEVYRVLKPGGRYVINIANLGRKPYIPLHSFFYMLHIKEIGFLPMGEIIWQKGRGASGNCAWGSWRSAKAPRLRDLHEYLLVFAKQSYSRPDKGESTIERDEFMAATLSVWEIAPESARRVGHPAPFPIELAQRVIQLYSYLDDVVLDPFMGSGTTCVAAKQLGRKYIGFDISEEYCAIARERLEKTEYHESHAEGQEPKT